MFKARLYWRVLGNFGLLLLILTAMTFLTLRILGQMEQNFRVTSNDVTGLSSIEPLRRYLNDVPTAADQYLLTGSQAARKLYQDGWNDFGTIVSNLTPMLPDSSSQRDMRQLRALFYAWVQHVGDRKVMMRDTALSPADFRERLAALATLELEMHYLTDAREIIRAMYQQRIASQLARIERAASLSNQIGTFVTLVNILLALFAAALGFVLTRSITSPVEQLKLGTMSIMEGKFELIELNRSDEFGNLAADFNKMSVMLRNNYGRLNAYSELMTELNTRAELEEVEKTSLHLLCSHTGSSVGALYRFDKDAGLLHIAAGYALRLNGDRGLEYRLDEGIPGLCAAARKTLEVKEVKTSTEFLIDTGLGTVPPRSILAVPIMFQEDLIGVIVLGLTEEINDLKREIVMNSVPQIGVAITNAQNVEATRQLSRQLARTNEEINRKNEELQKAYRVKSDFLSNMSHELRTPLNSIIGFTSVLLGQHGDPLTPDQRKALDKVLKNGKHLLQLINDILDFSKIESGRMPINVEEDEVANVVSDAILTVESLIRSKNLTINHEIPSGLPRLHTDILKVKQILVNLLSNSTKFTETGGITVTAAKKNGNIEFRVKDTGIGIEPKNLERVFEEFQQIDSSASRKYKGTGLGLPISRRFAQALGGNLIVESEFGKGSTFVLTLPAVLPVDKTPKTVTAEPAAPAPAPPTPKAEPAQPTKSGVQVLCIDDDQDVIDILRNYLVPEGYSVHGALSGDEGIKLAEQIKPSVITLDIMMPQKDGWQVLRELKRNPTTKDIPVIVHSIVENKPLALSLGAIDVIAKPSDSKHILSVVEHALTSKDQSVLIVDDEEDFAEAVKTMLTQEGFKVQVATSGDDALRSIAQTKPALILLDLIMPGMDGFEVVRRLQGDSAWANIPIVILSGKDLTPEDREKLNSHIREYIHKGRFSQEVITGALHRILARPTPTAA